VADWDPDSRPKNDNHFYQLSIRAIWQVYDATTLTSITAYNRYLGNAVESPAGADIVYR
jgi:outer membrane scaffolding protein for murein synthesis (MipA/OmpV family)